MSGERYSQDQVAAILRRSAEIEGEKLRNPPAAELSLGELEQIAEESGLDPASVRAAAREFAAPPPVPLAGTLAKPPAGARLHHQRQFDGELDEAELERLVQSAGTRLNLPGHTTRDGQGWQWGERWGHRRLRVQAGSRSGRTTIELDEDLRGLSRKLTGGLMTALGSFGIAFGFAFGMNVESSIAGALIFAALGGAGSLAAGFGVSRLMFRQFRRTRDIQLQRLAAELDREGRELLAQVDDERPPVADETEHDAESAPRHSSEQESDDDASRRRGRQRNRS